MAEIDDIRAARDAAIATIDQEILAALALKRAAGSEDARDRIEDECVQPLLEMKEAILDQSLARLLDSQQVGQALATLQAATDDMQKTSQRMVTVTQTLNKISDFLGFAQRIVAALT